MRNPDACRNCRHWLRSRRAQHSIEALTKLQKGPVLTDLTVLWSTILFPSAWCHLSVHSHRCKDFVHFSINFSKFLPNFPKAMTLKTAQCEPGGENIKQRSLVVYGTHSRRGDNSSPVTTLKSSIFVTVWLVSVAPHLCRYNQQASCFFLYAKANYRALCLHVGEWVGECEIGLPMCISMPVHYLSHLKSPPNLVIIAWWASQLSSTFRPPSLTWPCYFSFTSTIIEKESQFTK